MELLWNNMSCSCHLIHGNHYYRRCNAKPSYPTPRMAATKMAVAYRVIRGFQLGVSHKDGAIVRSRKDVSFGNERFTTVPKLIVSKRLSERNRYKVILILLPVTKKTINLYLKNSNYFRAKHPAMIHEETHTHLHINLRISSDLNTRMCIIVSVTDPATSRRLLQYFS
jgi:hypothetical protein